MNIKKPMLACALTEDKHFDLIAEQLPLMASAKIDGIRLLIHPNHGPVTRKFKPIPNQYIHRQLRNIGYNGLDGEIVTLNEDGSFRTFNEVQGDVMRKTGEPDFLYLVFDLFTTPGDFFSKRFRDLRLMVENINNKRIRLWPHNIVQSVDEIHTEAKKALAEGWEGLMLRSPAGPYKEGRSTVRQGWLAKVKAFEDAEGTIIRFEERMHNGNEAKKDATGHTERSSCKENMVPMGTLGALVLNTQWGELKVGSGFDDATRQKIWDNHHGYLGKTVTFTYQPFGAKDKPRFPVFKGFRKELD